MECYYLIGDEEVASMNDVVESSFDSIAKKSSIEISGILYYVVDRTGEGKEVALPTSLVVRVRMMCMDVLEQGLGERSGQRQ